MLHLRHSAGGENNNSLGSLNSFILTKIQALKFCKTVWGFRLTPCEQGLISFLPNGIITYILISREGEYIMILIAYLKKQEVF